MQIHTNLPLFTIIIPVKNRIEYIEHTLKTCMIQEYPNLEIIVSDDDSTDNTKEKVEQIMISDKRIKLFTHHPGIGMKNNFEFALNNVRPGYVIALGGDDGILPNGIQKMYEILSKTKAELLTWPCPHFIYKGYYSEHSKLVFSNSKGLKIIKSKDFLTRVTNTLNYLNDNECPMFYIKGVVATSLIEKVKLKSPENNFYSCPTPDGYSGIILAGEVNEFVFSGEPFSIAGDTLSSQGRAYLKNDEKSKVDAESFFIKSKNKPMHEQLASQPYSPLITLMTADYLLTAKEISKNKDYYPAINFDNLIRRSFNELSLKFHDDNLIIRELEILYKIAEKHNLINLFNKLVLSSKIKLNSIKDFEGSAFTKRTVIIDSNTIEINNIFEAASATKYIYSMYKNFSFKNVFSIILTMIKTYIKNKKNDYRYFPNINNLNNNK